MKILLHIVRWVAGIVIALTAFTFITSSPLSGLFILLTAVFLLPPSERWASSKVPLSTNVKISISVICFVIGFLLTPTKKSQELANPETENTAMASKYESYNKEVAQNISLLSTEEREKRDSVYLLIKESEIYKDLIERKSTDQKYFLMLEGIGEILASWDKDGFSISEDVAEKIQKNKAQMNFTLDVGMIIVRGGLPPELVDVLDRYRNMYGLHKAKGTILYDANGKGNKLQNNLNLVVAFGVMDPNNHQVLDGISEAALAGIHEWRDDKSETTNPHTYLYDKKSFNTFLKKNYPESKYVLSYDAEISAEKLFVAYDANEVAADNNYKDKQLLITGTVNEISKDFTDAIIVQLDGGGYIQEVWCYFDDAKAAANLSKGEKISVIGKCNGFMMKNVMIKDCTLAE